MKYIPNPDVKSTAAVRDALLEELKRLREKLENEYNPRTYTLLLETEAKFSEAQAKFIAAEEAEEITYEAFKKQRAEEEATFLEQGKVAMREFETRMYAQREERKRLALEADRLEAEKKAAKEKLEAEKAALAAEKQRLAFEKTRNELDALRAEGERIRRAAEEEAKDAADREVQRQLRAIELAEKLEALRKKNSPDA